MTSIHLRAPSTSALAVILAVVAAAGSASTTRLEWGRQECGTVGEASLGEAAATCEAALHADTPAEPGLGLLQSVAGAKEAGKRHSRARRREAARAPSPGLPVANAVNRTLYSSDPRASADFLVRYIYGTRPVPVWPLGATGKAGCPEAAAVEISWAGQAFGILFVRDRVKTEGPVPLDLFVKSSDAEWDKIMARQQDYSPWVDFHDGLPSILLNVHRLAQDGVRFQMYKEYVNRLNIPHTAWTIEFVDSLGSAKTQPLLFSAEDGRYWHYQGYQNPDKCRRWLPLENDRLWWKSTFAVADPLAATNFAIAVLGAHRIQSPYPWPVQKGCTAALWVELPSSDEHSGMELHFVQSLEYPPGALSIEEFNAYQARFRTSRSKQFDRYLYNSLVLVADDLDPFVVKLRSLGATFLALRLRPQTFALVFSFPRNDAVVLQIQGPKLTAVDAVDFEPCSEQ